MRGFFPGRFQPFHHGHRQFVEHVVEEADEVVVGIGSAGQSHTRENPFTAGERIAMIHGTLEGLDATTFVVPFTNVEPYALWVAHVTAMAPPFDAVYSNNPTVQRVVQEHGFDARGVDLFERERYSGTEVRRRMVEGEPWRDLVPDRVVEAVEEVDGVQRLRAISDDRG